MKNLSLILMLLFSVSGVYADSLDDMLNYVFKDKNYSKTVLSQDELNKILENTQKIYRIASKQEQADVTDEVFTGFTPKDLYTDYYDIASDLYINGYAKKAHFDFYLKEYDKLLNINPVTIANPVPFWENKFYKLWSDYLLKINNDPQSCAGDGINATNRKCCNGLVQMTQSIEVAAQCKSQAVQCKDNTECCSGVCDRENKNQLGLCVAAIKKKSGGVCDKNDDCRSGLCTKAELNEPGICSSIKQCYSLAGLNEPCGGEQPYCVVGACQRVYKQVTGLGECVKDGYKAGSDGECCSEKLVAGVCQPNFLCKNCVKSGRVPAQGQECCPGYYKSSNGKCKLLMNPLIPKSGEVKSKNILNKILNILIPKAHAQVATGENVCNMGDQSLTEAQTKLIRDKNAECNSLIGEEKVKCQMALNDLQNSFCQDNKDTMANDENGDQQNLIDQARAQCAVNNFVGAQDTLNLEDLPVSTQECLKAVTKTENEWKEANMGPDGTGAAEEKNRFAEFIDRYKAPPITAKTYSDAKNCNFNSFNDNWKAASNLEKNAELFLRSFEYVYSSGGSQDYWDDPDNADGNVFSRAQKVALAFRQNRAKFLETSREIDRKITCKCIAIWGPDEFPAQKQQFFTENCAEEAASLRSELATGDQSNGGTGGSNVDGTTVIEGTEINSLNGQKTQDVATSEAKIEEIDKGALAISHEKLLIEFLQLRAAAQMDRFVDNSDLEEQLYELSEYISEVDFEEVWRDRVQGKTIVKNSPPGDTVLLYKWGYKYAGFLLKFLIVGLAIALGGISFSLLGAIVGGALGFSVTTLFKKGAGAKKFVAVTAALLAAYGPSFPEVTDIQKVKGKKYNLLYDWDGFEKWYVGPRFDNNSTSAETRCQIYARASACFRSAYEFTPQQGEMKYLTDIELTGHYIIDPKVPLFVDGSKISTATMPGLNQTWVQIMNDTRNAGVAFLKSTRPSNSNLKRDYKKAGKKFGKNDMMQRALDNRYFLPLRGEFVPQDFDDERSLITQGATKYAMCKELQGNTEDPSCNTEVKTVPGDVGYGYLFEVASEAREWAEYTFEMHYVYSSITVNKTMGYPLLGMDAYFQAVAYNMKLVGSLAVERAGNYNDAVALYMEDWEKRKSDYSKNLTDSKLGNEFENLKYSQGFYAAFDLLNFSGVTDLEAFQAVVDKGQKNGSFSSSELSALNAGKNSAVRLNKAIANEEQFKKDTKDLKNGEGLNLTAQSDAIGALNNPINTIVSRNPGGAFARGKFGEALNSIDSKLAALSKNKPNFKNNGSSFKFGGFKPSTGGYNAFSSPGIGGDPDGNSASAEQRLMDQNMSVSDANKLINALNNNKSLTEANENDTLFTRVSKAYKRSYSKVLYLRADLVRVSEKAIPKKKKITNTEKEKLRKLLEEDN